jgi:hypothetical protein
VSRRLFGSAGGAFALALYVFCPAVVRYATVPNNEVLAMWGLYGVVYTAMGVAHALQGPRAKWKPRIILLTIALGLTGSAHLLAGMVGFLAGGLFFFYLAERRRAYVAQIMIYAALSGLVIVFAGFGFRPSGFLYVFAGGAGRFWFATHAVQRFATLPVSAGLAVPQNAGILVAMAVALLLYLGHRRSRYFGNTAPLLMVAGLACLYTTQVVSAPWVWALPFLFTFVGGVFADTLDGPNRDGPRETRQRRVFLLLMAGVVVTQAALCWVTMAAAAA